MSFCHIRRAASSISRHGSSPTGCPGCGASPSWSRRSRPGAAMSRGIRFRAPHPTGTHGPLSLPLSWPICVCTPTFAGATRALRRSPRSHGRLLCWSFIQACRSAQWPSSSTTCAHVQKSSTGETLASAPVGTFNTAIFLTATNLDMLAVPYGGQPPAILDLRANRVQFNVSWIGLVTEHVVSGAVKALAVLGTARSPLLPNTPTVSEAGYPEINVVPWYGFAVPSGTPQPVVEKIAAGFQEVIQNRTSAGAAAKTGT